MQDAGPTGRLPADKTRVPLSAERHMTPFTSNEWSLPLLQTGLYSRGPQAHQRLVRETAAALWGELRQGNVNFPGVGGPVLWGPVLFGALVL